MTADEWRVKSSMGSKYEQGLMQDLMQVYARSCQELEYVLLGSNMQMQ